jgi:hypothetical protein
MCAHIRVAGIIYLGRYYIPANCVCVVTRANASVRQHTSAYVSIHIPANCVCVVIRTNAKRRCLIYGQHTVRRRQHTSAYVSIHEDIYQPTLSVWSSEEQRRAVAVCTCICQHTSAYVSFRGTAESRCLVYVRMRPHTSAYVSIRPHTSA